MVLSMPPRPAGIRSHRDPSIAGGAEYTDSAFPGNSHLSHAGFALPPSELFR